MVELPDARDHAAPCRPTISCTADFASPGTLEAEVGYLAAKGDASYVRSSPFLLKLTLSKLLQLQVGGNGVTWVEPARSLYFDNLELGLKIHLFDQTKYGPSMAVTGLVGVPIQFGLEAFVTLHVSKDVGPIHADLNAGAAELAIDTAPVSQGFFAFALSTSIPKTPFGLALEVYDFTDSPPLAPHDGGFRFVVTSSPRPWLVFDAGGDAGFFPSVRSFSVFFGVTIVPVVFWRK
jgi:hypothetical protein